MIGLIKNERLDLWLSKNVKVNALRSKEAEQIDIKWTYFRKFWNVRPKKLQEKFFFSKFLNFVFSLTMASRNLYDTILASHKSKLSFYHFFGVTCLQHNLADARLCCRHQSRWFFWCFRDISGEKTQIGIKVHWLRPH